MKNNNIIIYLLKELIIFSFIKVLKLKEIVLLVRN